MKSIQKHNIKIYLLVLIVLIGAFLRLYKLDYQSLWNDELYHWWISYNTTYSAIINEVAVNDVHPPADHIFLYFLEKYVGDSELILRFPSAILGILSIIAIYFLTLKIYSKKEAIIASALTAFLHFPIYYSQEARPYSLLFLLTIISFIIWIPLIDNYLNSKKQKKYLIACYLIVAFLLSYLHYFGLYVVILQCLASFLLLFRTKNNLSKIIILYIALFILYIPWLPVMFSHLKTTDAYIKNDLLFAFKLFIVFFNKSTVVSSITALIFLYFIYMRFSKKILLESSTILKKINSDLFLLLWILIPLVIIYIKSYISVPVLTYRNMIIVLPAFIILLSRALSIISFKKVNNVSIVSLYIFIIIFDLVVINSYYSKPTKEQFREGVKYITDNESKYPNSLKIGYAWDIAYFTYYFKKYNSNSLIDMNAGSINDTLKVKNLVANSQCSYIWYVTGHLIPDENFIAFMKTHYKIITQKEYVGAKCYLFQNN